MSPFKFTFRYRKKLFLPQSSVACKLLSSSRTPHSHCLMLKSYLNLSTFTSHSRVESSWCIQMKTFLIIHSDVLSPSLPRWNSRPSAPKSLIHSSPPSLWCCRVFQLRCIFEIECRILMTHRALYLIPPSVSFRLLGGEFQLKSQILLGKRKFIRLVYNGASTHSWTLINK